MAAKAIYDPLLGKIVYHDHGATSGDYLPLAGGILTGDVTYPATGYIMLDSNGVRWRVTMNTDGSLQTTAITEGVIGTPWLWMMGAI
jgi:hypothetical protein